MTRSRMDWLVCRLAPGTLHGAEYVEAALSDDPAGVCLVVVADRDRACLLDSHDANALANTLNRETRRRADRGDWTALPAQIHVPSPYQPQEKGPDERHRGATAEDIAILRAAIFSKTGESE